MFINDFLTNKKAISEGIGDAVGDTVQKLATKVGDKLSNALPKEMQPFNNDTAAKTYASLKPTKEPVKENTGVTKHNDYDTWRDQIETVGGIVHPQRDRVHLVAQSWAGDTIGEFNLKINQGYINQQGVTEAGSPAQQAAIAINMKKHHNKPKSMKEAQEQFDMIEHMVESLAQARGVDAEQIWEDLEAFDDETLLDESAAWHRKAGKSAKGGLNRKGVASYRREHPGSHLQMAVTTKPSKLKRGSKAAKRRKSFCARMGGVKGPMKKPNGKPTRKALALRKWNCESIEEMQQLIMIAEQQIHNMKQHHKKPKGVAEGKGDFAQAIENLHGWYEVESSNPGIRIWEFDDREGGHYAQGTVYYIEKTGRIQIEFEDHDGYHGGDVTDAFDSIGDAMNVLKNITVQIRPNTGKARDFDKLGGRTLAGPDDLYKTDRVGRKGTLNKSRMDAIKAFSPYRKTGPEGQLPESGVEEATGDPKFDKMLKGITGKRKVAKQQKTDTKQQARDAFGGMFGGGNPADKLGIRKKNVDEGSELPPNVVDMIKKIAQSSAAPEHKKAMINALIAKYKDHNMAEAEGDPEGLPHLTKQLLTHIVQQVGYEGAHAIIKSLEWGDGAADELLQLIVNDLKQDARGEVDETYGGQLHTKHKKNRFKQIKKIKQTQNKAFGLRSLEETGCNMTQEGQECPMHGLQECPGYGMTETSAQDKLHQHHQEIRKKSGLPHPDHYLKMMKQKQAEIDALRAEIASDKAKGLGEARKPDVNFDIEDIKKLEKIRDLPTLKTLAFELISRPSTKPMKPEKVEWFRSALERMDSPLKVIKLMYDLMLSGEGHQVIGSRNSMKANSYRGRFSEATVTPRFNGFQQTTDDDGTVTSDYSVGPVSASTTQRPNTINTTSATVPLAHNVQLTVDKGIGFGGAGKNVTPGGNQVSTITARTAQNPQGTTSSFVGQPTTQDLEKAIPKDWAPSDDEFSDDINETVERYVEELGRAGYDIVTESATACPECGGPAYSNSMLAEKQDACYHKVKSRYKVWPSAYASGALVRCRKVGANNWGNKSKK